VRQHRADSGGRNDEVAAHRRNGRDQHFPAALTRGSLETATRWPPAGVFRVGHGVRSPEVLKEEKPIYPEAALASRIQGSVELEAVVLTNGTVGEVRVIRSLDKQFSLDTDFGLDEAAVYAFKRWQFRPAMRDGVAVPVITGAEMSFVFEPKRPK
jgi:TonB family protein